jgi:cytochrome c553
MRRSVSAAAFAAGLAVGLSSLPAMAEQTVDIRLLAGTCAGCHGADLQGSGAIPTLRGHGADYLRFMLDAFKSGERQATVMNRLAAGYAEAEIEALADYLSTLQ